MHTHVPYIYTHTHVPYIRMHTHVPYIHMHTHTYLTCTDDAHISMHVCRYLSHIKGADRHSYAPTGKQVW